MDAHKLTFARDLIIECIEDSKIVYPEIYKKFKEKKILSNFENDIVTIYLFSVFNENTLSPDKDFFLVKFNRYETKISRSIENNTINYFCSHIQIDGDYEVSNPQLIKKLKTINPRFPEYLNK